MGRATGVDIDASALLHNLKKIEQSCPNSKIIAMVKANAYGCGLSQIIPILDGQVALFGVACLEEAMAIRALGARTKALLAQGVFTAEEYQHIENMGFESVIHQPHQLAWLKEKSLSQAQKIWVKVNTGMNRLGFPPSEIAQVIEALRTCPWVSSEIGIMSHFACADDLSHPANKTQLETFNQLVLPGSITYRKSLANSAAIINFPEAHKDYVRPGIMLYGVSPFKAQNGVDLGLKPVMRFHSFISAIHKYPSGASLGYGATWQCPKSSKIGVVAAGYADGYPRHLTKPTFVWINGNEAPIVGRISMDMLTVDLSNIAQVAIGDRVELWGNYIPVEDVALSSETIGYELLCQFAKRGIIHPYGMDN